jgi:hypothetical protein
MSVQSSGNHLTLNCELRCFPVEQFFLLPCIVGGIPQTASCLPNVYRLRLQLAQLVVHNSNQPGRRPPSQFRDLQQALDYGPVTPLVTQMEYENIKLQDVMLALFRLHPTEDLYRILGFAPTCSEGFTVAHKVPIADMVAGFLEKCSKALMQGGLEALREVGPDVETGGRDLLAQVGVDRRTV